MMLQSQKPSVHLTFIIFLFLINCNRRYYEHYVIIENEKLSYNKDHFYSLKGNYFIYFT